MSKSIKRVVGIRVTAALISVLLFSGVTTYNIFRIQRIEADNAQTTALLQRAQMAEAAHYRWSAGLSNALYAGTEFTGSIDPTTCVLGQWLYGEAGTEDASVLSIRSREFIESARAIGTGDLRIIVKHIIPNAIGPVIVQATLGVGEIIISAAGLSFLGLGIEPPLPEWGKMLSEGEEVIRTMPSQVVYPGLCIMITVLSLNLLGDGLRDALDPRLK